MEFQLSYFKSWKMMLWKCCTQYASKSGKLSNGHRMEKVSFHSNPKERQCQRMFKLHSSHMLVMFKILQSWLQQCVNHELPDVKLDLEKAEEPEIELSTSVGLLKKLESSRKISTSALLTIPRPLTVWITTNSGKFLNRWEYQTTWAASKKSVCRSRSNS